MKLTKEQKELVISKMESSFKKKFNNDEDKSKTVEAFRKAINSSKELTSDETKLILSKLEFRFKNSSNDLVEKLKNS